MRYLRITAPASQDLEAISEYFLEMSIDAGDRFVQTFNQKCQHLARFPYIPNGLRGVRVVDGYKKAHPDGLRGLVNGKK
ncbi:MAG: type II toxin-antitoxin system RelE/ParE family toxin [Nostoc sp.]|uniref:type II toxin-antitoxin system RelE/ParE family toxin n=1 Tax=Nostoc sp. TaxID=1180 RepID=UPI002FF71D65